MTTITHLEQDVVATAQTVADLLPTSAPLAAGQVMSLDEAASSIPQDAVAAHAEVLGAQAGSVVLVVDRDLATALADSPMGPLPLVDALRPALEALRVALGVGALGQVMETTAAGAVDLLRGRDCTIVPLQGPEGPAAWLAVFAAQPAAGAIAAAAEERPASPAGMELLQDVVMELSAELGRTTMTVRELLSLQPGAVVELDRLAGSPADLLVNGRLIARGEVVVVDEDYALKITELISSTLPDNA
ncbi:flagellar motor switch protein FliN [Angustibacter sp. McL0619]|uniref:flagellar motor switch protein FliN n=1 Tax=Angustibacter sp. McL0619 TaxID=3415676 RepID=UPI003CEFA92E